MLYGLHVAARLKKKSGQGLPLLKLSLLETSSFKVSSRLTAISLNGSQPSPATAQLGTKLPSDLRHRQAVSKASSVPMKSLSERLRAKIAKQRLAPELSQNSLHAPASLALIAPHQQAIESEQLNKRHFLRQPYLLQQSQQEFLRASALLTTKSPDLAKDSSIGTPITGLVGALQ